MVDHGNIVQLPRQQLEMTPLHECCGAPFSALAIESFAFPVLEYLNAEPAKCVTVYLEADNYSERQGFDLFAVIATACCHQQ